MIVFSGINLFEGGPLSIFYDCLNAVRELKLYERDKILVFVYRKELFEQYSDIAEIIELPKSRKSYLYRLYYEYIYFNKISKRIDVDVWVSLHDITPKVKVKKLYTYCHNPSPFMKKDIKNIRYSLTYVLFSYFYKFLYRINIENAAAIIVQQNWMREEFLKMYPIRNVIVARPNQEKKKWWNSVNRNTGDKKIFIFASYPRFFKNFEVICKASKVLSRIVKYNYEIWLTVDGTENRYAAKLKREYEKDTHIKWLGIQKREQLFQLFDQSSYMIFPSKLETWGLPISEYKNTGKGILLADLPYAHETLGTYEKVMFFDCDDYHQLAKNMELLINDKPEYSPQTEKKIQKPYAENWSKLLNMLFLEKV